jgi:hypothetical protein
LVDCCSAFHFHDAGKLVTQQLQPSARPLAIAPTLLKVFGLMRNALTLTWGLTDADGLNKQMLYRCGNKKGRESGST